MTLCAYAHKVIWFGSSALVCRTAKNTWQREWGRIWSGKKWPFVSAKKKAKEATAPSLSPDEGVALLRCILRARLVEERLVRLYHQGRIFGGVYTGIGQEAIGAATALAGGPDDVFAPCIRDMTVHIARGESVLNIFRQ